MQLSLSVLEQASKALRDRELEAFCAEYGGQTKRQVGWLQHRIRQSAPQTLVVAD